MTDLAWRLDPEAGWYGVFARRDPEGLRACLEGREVPPWDVVESLLYDLAELPGEQGASAAGARARRLHAHAVADIDARPGSRPALEERLAAMVREERRAAQRAGELQEVARTAHPPQARLAEDLAWVRDDHARAASRADELRARLEALGRAEARGRERAGRRKAKRPARPRGARFAGLEETEEAPEEYVNIPAPAAAQGATPRGARFAGALQQGPDDGGPADSPPPEVAAEERVAAATAVSRLTRLRATGDGGLAYAELCAAAHRPAAELPLLIEELERAGLSFDVPTLLWEAACLPPDGLAAAADALTAADRGAEGTALLRQAVSRPVEEVALTALALLERDRGAQALELLAALVRSRTPEEAAAAEAVAPDALGPLLLAAAESVSPHRHSDIAHALRIAHR
ncbi:hypothetical protein B1H19_32205 [Streptomyces gilvosporeus]|uniref:UL36 very large tegument protein n=1 Tax=Streptomyces gilvosporeus TaxID=553510 RepID=A0A1V0U3S4_9ACTN|nr:hypothetical protein B1H19_32205 [Streptomyces gilvosporeus]